MKPRQLDFDLDTADPDGFADNNASSVLFLDLDGALMSGDDLDGIADNNSSASTTLTLDGTLVSGGVYVAADGEGHHIKVLDTATVDQSGATFVITGQDQNDKVVIEDLTGPGSTLAVQTATRFKRIDSITIVSPAALGTVDVGPQGVYSSVDGLARQLSITDTATQVQTDSVFTVTGEDADGRVQTEAITGPGSGATVESAKYFKKVYKVTIAGGDASDTVDMGTVDEAVSATIPLDHYQGVAPTVQADVTGTVDFDLQVTVQDPFNSGSAPFNIGDQEDLAWIVDANFDGKTADLVAALAVPGMRAMRFLVNSHSAAAEVQLYITQPRSV